MRLSSPGFQTLQNMTSTQNLSQISNECPAEGNPLCAMPTTSDTNQYGANVNFDLCTDSGAAAAFLGPSGVGLATGTATRVDCDEWTGADHYGKVPRRGLAWSDVKAGNVE